MIDWKATISVNSASKKNDIHRPKSEFNAVLHDIVKITNTARENGFSLEDEVVENACQKVLVIHGWLQADYLAALAIYNENVIKNNASALKIGMQN